MPQVCCYLRLPTEIKCICQDCRRRSQSGTRHEKKYINLHPAEARCFYRAVISHVTQGQKSRPLLIFELTVLQRPEKHQQTNAKSNDDVCNEVREIHEIYLYMSRHVRHYSLKRQHGVFTRSFKCSVLSFKNLVFYRFYANTSDLLTAFLIHLFNHPVFVYLIDIGHCTFDICYSLSVGSYAASMPLGSVLASLSLIK